jgi:hypothetical protein
MPDDRTDSLFGSLDGESDDLWLMTVTNEGSSLSTHFNKASIMINVQRYRDNGGVMLDFYLEDYKRDCILELAFVLSL